ncbi:MAG: GreA/GreB family elongation factor [Burkholderiaceae bacterium]
MNTEVTPERMLTELDYARITRLVRVARDTSRGGVDSAIDDALDKADLVAPRGVAPHVVTMNSHVLLKDLETGEEHRWILCYPSRADWQSGLISVLSPAGAGLLGRSVGSVARWTVPTGAKRSAEVLAILFQPEASGNYVL